MKEYIAPAIERIQLTERVHLCAASPIERKATWGSKETFGTEAWINEGYGEHDTKKPVVIEDDNGELSSMSKQFNAWDDWE